MTDKEQIAMLREALQTCSMLPGAPKQLRGPQYWFDEKMVKNALAATAPSAQGQEKVGEQQDADDCCGHKELCGAECRLLIPEERRDFEIHMRSIYNGYLDFMFSDGAYRSKRMQNHYARWQARAALRSE